MGVGPCFEPKNTQNHAFFLQFYVYKPPSRNDPKSIPSNRSQTRNVFLKITHKIKVFCVILQWKA